MNICGTGWRQMGCCECCNKLLGSLKCEEFLNKLVKKEPNPRSEFMSTVIIFRAI